MKKSDVFLFDQCLVIVAFVLSLNGLEIVGMLSGGLAIVSACRSLNKNVIKNDRLMILTVSFIELCIFEIVGLNRMYPSLYLESLCSLIVSFVWNHSGHKARSYGMKWMLVAGFTFLIASMISPFHRFSRMITIVITLCIFFPSILLYVHKQYCYYKRNIHRNIKVSVVK